jgi:hypothetical protein
MARTFYPGAVLIAQQCHKYLTRYQSSLVPDITSDQASALADLIICLAAFLAKWPKPTVLP